MVTTFHIMAAKWLSPILPNLAMSGVAIEDCTRNEEQRKLLAEDKLFWHGGVKLRNGYAGLKALEKVEKNMGQINIPIYIQHGSADAICRPEGSKKLFETVQSMDKQIKLYQDAFHDLFIEYEDVVKECIDDEYQWINKRI